MEKSTTANQETIEKIIDTSVDYIKNWSTKQALELASNVKTGEAPLIVEIGDRGFLIGNYVLLRDGKFKWKLCYRYSNFEKIFSNKKAGLIAAVYYQTGKSNLADKIYDDDNLVNSIYSKVKFYEYRINQTKRAMNYDRMDFYKVRYDEYVLKLSSAKNLLEKKLNLAKYI